MQNKDLGGNLGQARPDSGDSVHLAEWPSLSGWPDDHDLHAAMDPVRSACSTAVGHGQFAGLVPKLTSVAVRLQCRQRVT